MFHMLFSAPLVMLLRTSWTLKMSKSALNLKAVFAKERTFRPKKKFEPGTVKFELHKKAQASLRSGKILLSNLP